jgi:hypothetical protein
LVTDKQVKLLRRKLREGNTQEAAAVAAGMSARSVQDWKTGPLPSESNSARACRIECNATCWIVGQSGTRQRGTDRLVRRLQPKASISMLSDDARPCGSVHCRQLPGKNVERRVSGSRPTDATRPSARKAAQSNLKPANCRLKSFPPLLTRPRSVGGRRLL